MLPPGPAYGRSNTVRPNGIAPYRSLVNANCESAKAQRNPNCQVLGSDLSLIQTGQPPANCRFIQQDLENEEWKFEHRFVYIHFRYIVICFDDTRAVIKKAYDGLKPGGWIEFYDVVPVTLPVDDTIHGSAVEQWYKLFAQGARAAGRDLLRPEQYGRWCEEAGFVNLTVKRFPLPGNGLWPKDFAMKKIGNIFMTTQTGLVDILTKFIRLAGQSAEETASLEARVKKDLRNPNIRYYQNM